MSYLPFTRPSIDEETIRGVAEVLRSGWITSGPQVKAFEAQLSQYVGGRPVRAFNSGTCTMEIGLRIAGVGPGHEVITTPLSWVATSNVIVQVGARPVFVDIDPATRNIDLKRMEAAITPRTRALLPVDLAGLPVDRDRLYQIAHAHRLRVIEDAAQALGSTWGGRRIGSFGDLTSFSFHPNKNVTSIEGGCLVMNDAAEAHLAEQYRLPRPIIDFIRQHHGTTLVEYFFRRAQQNETDETRGEVEEHSYRYPGPKPQSKEAGVLMLADAAESASRTLVDPAPARLESLVHDLAMSRLLDGQFDDCGLTLQELHAVEESLVKSLTAVYHGRVRYPEQRTA